MDLLPFDEESFDGQLPLFPLPNVVLLPGGLLSLHIFEQRYRDMVKAAAAGDQLIGMASLKPGYEGEYDGNPPIYKEACLGEMTRDLELPDGRWLITLRGLRRVEILEEDLSRSFRIATVRLMRDSPGTTKVELARSRRLIAELMTRVPGVDSESEGLRRLIGADESSVPTSLWLDLLAAVAPLEVEDRRELLSAKTLCERAHLLLGGLVHVIDGHLEGLEQRVLGGC